MKKFLALSLVCLLLIGGTCVAIAAGADNAVAPQSATTNSVYLVPGTYVDNGVKVANTIASGATKLSEEQCEEIFTENAYLCTLAEGTKLPTPTSTRVDKEGNPYTFNGWWAIVDATITYFDKVPSSTVAPFLYADWRADLSQRMDPVEPGISKPDSTLHYLLITHSNGETEQIGLGVKGADSSIPEDLGYGIPVELFNTNLTLTPGDKIEVYTVGLSSSKTPEIAPTSQSDGNPNRRINLESSGTTGNVTANYLAAYPGNTWRQSPYLTYKLTTTMTFAIYIKFYSDGHTMAVYMEPSA